MTENEKIGVDAETFRTLAREARLRGTQDKFIDLALEWSTAVDKYIKKLAKLLEEAGIECICEGVDPLNPDCPLHEDDDAPNT